MYKLIQIALLCAVRQRIPGLFRQNRSVLSTYSVHSVIVLGIRAVRDDEVHTAQLVLGFLKAHLRGGLWEVWEVWEGDDTGQTPVRHRSRCRLMIRQCSQRTTQYNTVQYNTVQHSTAYSTAYGTAYSTPHSTAYSTATASKQPITASKQPITAPPGGGRHRWRCRFGCVGRMST